MAWRLLPHRLISLSDPAVLNAFPYRASIEGREHMSQHTVELRRRRRPAVLELESNHFCILVKLFPREVLGHQIRWVSDAQHFLEFNDLRSCCSWSHETPTSK